MSPIPYRCVFRYDSAQQNSDGNVIYNHYNGVVFGYDETNVYVFAPTDTGSTTSNYVGTIVGLSDGWGGNVQNGVATTADVRYIKLVDQIKLLLD